MTDRPPVQPRERLAPGKAAAICGFSTKTLVKHAKAGKIPGAAELLPGVWRFDEGRLRDWIRGQEIRCQGTAKTSSSGAASGTREFKLTGATSADRYERLLGQRRASE